MNFSLAGTTWRKLVPWLPAGLPPNRSLICDLLYFQLSMPVVSHRRRFDLLALQAVRNEARPAIKWPLLFLKAFAFTAEEFPRLRQTYMSYPWPHVHEHEYSIANVAITREYAGEQWLFFAPFYQPERKALAEMQELLRLYKESPVPEVFKTQLRLAHFPLPLRRVLWWLRFHYSARKRVKRLGTFGLTTLASQGVTILDPRAPVTCVLTYGPLDEQGQCEVTIAYDHRVMDGSEIARVLCRLEQIMQTTIAEELRQLEDRSGSAQAA